METGVVWISPSLASIHLQTSLSTRHIPGHARHTTYCVDCLCLRALPLAAPFLSVYPVRLKEVPRMDPEYKPSDIFDVTQDAVNAILQVRFAQDLLLSPSACHTSFMCMACEG